MKIVHKKTVFSLISLLVIYIISGILLNNLNTYQITKQAVVYGNTTVYYKYYLVFNNGGLLPLNDINIAVYIPELDELDNLPSIYFNNSVENCRMSQGINIIPISINCDKINLNGYLGIEWESPQSLESIPIIIYSSDFPVFNIKIPYFSFTTFGNATIENSSSSSQTPTSVHNISIDSFEPLRPYFYNNSIAIAVFHIGGTEGDTYDFRANWYKPTGELGTTYMNSYTINSSLNYNLWYYPLVSTEGNWTVTLEAVSIKNKTEKNTTFILINNATLLPFLISSDCSNWTTNTTEYTLKLISYYSEDEFSQVNDVLTYLRINSTEDSYNSSIELLNSLRSIGIPSQLVSGASEIGSTRYWVQFYTNNSWLPVDVSSSLPIGQISPNYIFNVTVLDC